MQQLVFNLQVWYKTNLKKYEVYNADTKESHEFDSYHKMQVFMIEKLKESNDEMIQGLNEDAFDRRYGLD